MAGHPHVKTSSDDGLFDSAGCEECEIESENAAHDAWILANPEEHAANLAFFDALKVTEEVDRAAATTDEIPF